MRKAQQLGVEIIDEQQFIQMVKDHIPNQLKDKVKL
ncbi:MAG: hypothetical protein Q9M89_03320 [Persephonella sp.]|nr:hypothetical protein [Persephonella sp.]